VRLVSIDGRTIEQAAAAEGIPESTVRARLRDGAEDLRGELSRRRAEERRKSGFSSWLAAWGLMDLRAFRRVGSALAATAVGGMLFISGEVVPVRPDASEHVRTAPAPVALVEDPPPPAVEAAPVAPVRPAGPSPVRERTRHDAGKRFRAERFGAE
jgi:hypothetical protein